MKPTEKQIFARRRNCAKGRLSACSGNLVQLYLGESDILTEKEINILKSLHSVLSVRLQNWESETQKLKEV